MQSINATPVVGEAEPPRVLPWDGHAFPDRRVFRLGRELTGAFDITVDGRGGAITIAGPTGSGRSSTVDVMLAQWFVPRIDSADLRGALIFDMKGALADSWAPEDAVDTFDRDDLDDIADTLVDLAAQIASAQREARRSRMRALTWGTQPTTATPPQLLVVIDGLEAMLDALPRTLPNGVSTSVALRDIIEHGPEAGILPVITCGTGNAAQAGFFLASRGSRVLLGADTLGAAVALGADATVAPLPPYAPKWVGRARSVGEQVAFAYEMFWHQS